MAEVVTRATPLDDLPELLRVKEVAAYLDCGRGVIYSMTQQGKLSVVKIGRLTRIPREAVRQMVKP